MQRLRSSRYLVALVLLYSVLLGTYGCATMTPGTTPASWIEEHRPLLRVSIQSAVSVVLVADPTLQEPLRRWVTLLQQSTGKPTSLEALQAFLLSVVPELQLPEKQRIIITQLVILATNVVDVALREKGMTLQGAEYLQLSSEVVEWMYSMTS